MAVFSDKASKVILFWKINRFLRTTTQGSIRTDLKKKLFLVLKSALDSVYPYTLKLIRTPFNFYILLVGLYLYYLMLRYVGGGHTTFCGFLNMGVHVVMYFYYFLSAFGPKVQKYLCWKRYKIILQYLFQYVFNETRIIVLKTNLLLLYK